MLWKAGVISLVLLLASRLLGVAREAAQAAAFGVSGAADVAVLMLTLPDWLTGLLASGALSYVLLPHWARQTPVEQAVTQRRVAMALLVGGGALALSIILLQRPIALLLMKGLPEAFQGMAGSGLIWAALALPVSLLGALWGTRLQNEHDLPGMYAGSLVVNGGIIFALLILAGGANAALDQAINWLGLALLISMLSRLAWLRWRLWRVSTATGISELRPGAVASLPGWRIWFWAILASGLPLALPFVARSLASSTGEGSLASFNYAWKLVELPLILVVQLVASLTFPKISRAFAERRNPAEFVRNAFVLTWTLACAATAALLVGAPAIAQLMFGWGRMEQDAVMRIANWSMVGAWSLLPQALTAVGLTVLAVKNQMHAAVAAYFTGLLVLLLVGFLGWSQGPQLMMVLNGVQIGVALVVIVVMRSGGADSDEWLPWRLLAPPFLVLMLVVALACRFSDQGASMLFWSVLAASSVMLVSWPLRNALRR